MEDPNEMFEEKHTNIMELYKNEELVEDERFGKITIMRTIKPENMAYEKIFKVERVIEGAEQLALCEQQVVTRLSLENENIIEMLDYSYTFMDDEYREFHFTGFYELPDTDLQREIMYRTRTGKNFTDLEIFNLIKDITNALYYLQANKLMHGDLRPKYVSLCEVPLDIEEMNESELEDEPQKFIFKLSDRLGNPLVPDQAQLMNMRNEEPLYMSPHLFESFVNGLNQIKLNPYKNDVFALGLIILESGLLEPIQNLYNYETGEFQYGFLENYKEKFFGKYDDAILRELLDNILEVDEDKRVTPIKLQKTVNSILASLENEDMEDEEVQEDPHTQDQHYEQEQIQLENVDVNPEYYENQEEFQVQEELSQTEEQSASEKNEEIDMKRGEEQGMGPHDVEFIVEEEGREGEEKREEQEEEERDMNEKDNLKDQYLQQLGEEYDEGTHDQMYSPGKDVYQEEREQRQDQYQEPAMENVEMEQIEGQQKQFEQDIKESEFYDDYGRNQEQNKHEPEYELKNVEPEQIKEQEFQENLEKIISPENEKNPETEELQIQENEFQQKEHQHIFEQQKDPENLFQEPEQEEELGIPHFEFQDKRNKNHVQPQTTQIVQESELYQEEIIPVEPTLEDQDYIEDPKANVFQEEFQGYEQYEEPEEEPEPPQSDQIPQVDQKESQEMDQNQTQPQENDKYEDEVYQFDEEEQHPIYQGHPDDPVFGGRNNQNNQQNMVNPVPTIKSQIVGVDNGNMYQEYQRNISQPVRTRVIEEPVHQETQFVHNQDIPQNIGQVHHQMHHPMQPHIQDPMHHPHHQPNQHQVHSPMQHQVFQPVHHQMNQPMHHQVYHDVNNQVHRPSPSNNQLDQNKYQQMDQPIHQNLDQYEHYHMDQPVQHYVEQHTQHHVEHPQIHHMDQPMHYQMNQPAQHTMDQPVHPQRNQPVQHTMDQPVHPQRNQPVQFIEQTETSPSGPIEQTGTYHDIPHQEPVQAPQSREELNFEHIESYKIDPEPNPVSFIDKNKIVKPIIKSPLESDVPYSHHTKDQPLYRLVSKSDEKQIPQTEIMQESIVENIEISPELPKNNGYADDKPFQGPGPMEEEDHLYMENVKQNFEQQYLNMYVNPHLNGHQLINNNQMEQLVQINERNKKRNSELISHEMKVGKAVKVESTQIKDNVKETRKLSNIEGLTIEGQEHIRDLTPDQINRKILDVDNQKLAEFVQVDEPFHHNIGVTLNQINTFASKNTKILEGQNDSSVPLVGQSEVMTPAKFVQTEMTSNVFNEPTEKFVQNNLIFKRQNDSSYYQVKSTTPEEPYMLSNQVKNQVTSNQETQIIQAKPGEIISFKKTSQPETQNINLQSTPPKMEIVSYSNTIQKQEYSQQPITKVDNSIRYQVNQPMKTSYINETKEANYSNMEQPKQVTQMQTNQPILKEPKQTVDSNLSKTTTSSRIIGKYEVTFNPQTKKKRIVISSKPIKFSHRTRPNFKKETMKTSQHKTPYFSTKSETQSSPQKPEPQTQFRSVLNNHVNNKPQIQTKSPNSITQSTNSQILKSMPISKNQSANKVTRVSVNTPPPPKIGSISTHSRVSTTSNPRTSSHRIPSSNNLPPKNEYNYTINQPKVIRVSRNEVTRSPIYQNKATFINTKNNSYASPVSGYRTSGMYGQVNHVNATKVITSGNSRPSYTGVISNKTTNSKKIKMSSNILSSYQNSNQVKAFSSGISPVNYIQKKSTPHTTKLASIYQPSTNISKNSIRYEKLQTNSFNKGTSPILIITSGPTVLTNTQKTTIANNKIYRKNPSIKQSQIKKDLPLSNIGRTVKFSDHTWGNSQLSSGRGSKGYITSGVFGKNRVIRNGNQNQRIVISASNGTRVIKRN